MVAWLTGELREMRKMHENGRPACAQVVAAFPRHPAGSVVSTCYALRLRQGHVDRTKWIRIAHEHFMKQEQRWAAYRYGS